jgi:hypothetical protein
VEANGAPGLECAGICDLSDPSCPLGQSCIDMNLIALPDVGFCG